MQVVKVLPGGQITLPEEIINTPGIKEGDILIIEKIEEGIRVEKGEDHLPHICGIIPLYIFIQFLYPEVHWL